MKIICALNDYASRRDGEHIFFYLKPDTALLNNNKPFFIPDFTDEPFLQPSIAVRIDRLGKNIEARFAHRYYNEITVALDITAGELHKTLTDKGLPWECSKSFDNSAVVGAFLPIDADNSIDYQLIKNEKSTVRKELSDLTSSIDLLIEQASRFFTFRTGDMLLVPIDAEVRKIKIGDRLEGFLNEKKVLECRVK